MFFRTAAAFAAALSISIAPAGAHEGHDHGGAASAAPAATTAASARAEAVGTAVELVALAEGTSLLLYLDAFATNKGILFEMADKLPGSRVLEGRWGLESLAIAVPKGRDAGAAWLKAFAADVAAQGQVQQAATRAGLRGTVAPPRP